MIKLKIKKLHEDAIIPKYATRGSVAFDICSLEDYLIMNGLGVYLVKTGLAFAIPEGYEMTIRARSGLSVEHPNYVANGIGTIDYDYRGEIMIPVINNTPVAWEIKKGDRIAQCIVSAVEICELELVDDLSKTERGAGGFGHTGVK